MAGAVKLSLLRVSLEGDASSYNKMASDKVASDQKMVASGNAVVQQTDRVSQASSRGVESLKRGFLDGYSASVSLETGLNRVQRGLDVGALTMSQASTITANLTKKYGEAATATGPLSVATGKVSDSMGVIAARSGVVGQVLSSFGTIGVAAAVGIGALITKIEGLRQFADVEQAQLRLGAVLKSTGFAAGVTSSQVEALAAEMSKSSFATLQEVRSSAAVLATFSDIAGTQFAEVLHIGEGMSAVFGGEMTEHVRLLGRALDDPTAGLGKLARAGVVLDPILKEQVKSLQTLGDVAGARAIEIDALSTKFGGAGEGSHAGLSGAFDSASKAMTAFNLALNSSPIFIAVVRSAVDLYTASLNGMTHAITGASAAEQLATLERIKAAQSTSAATSAAGGLNLGFGQYSPGNIPGLPVDRRQLFVQSGTANIDTQIAALRTQIGVRQSGDVLEANVATLAAQFAAESKLAGATVEQTKATDELLVSLQRKINLSKLDADAVTVQSAREAAFNAVLAANPNVAAAGGDEALRRTALAAANLAEQQARIAINTRNALAAEEAAAARRQATVDSLQAEISRRVGLTAAIDDEIIVLGREGVARDQITAVMAAQNAEMQNGNLLDQEELDRINARVAALDRLKQAQADAAQAASTAAAQQKVQTRELEQFITGSFDRIGSSITSAFANGDTAATAFKNIVVGVLGDIEQTVIRLGITNPLLNSLFGGNASGVLLPTLGGVSGIGNLFTTGNPISDTVAGPTQEGLFSGIGALFGLAGGGIMTSRGPLALPMNAYAAGGIASGPQLALFGEGRQSEAYIPLPDGRSVPVTMKGGAPANSIGGDTYHVYNVDARGSNDPAAVRLAVKQGIAEARPGIILDSAKTVQSSRLRAPKYFGGG